MKYKIIFLILFIFVTFSHVGAEIFPIDAEHNAQFRNNSGVLYMRERDYFAAIIEFKIAIAINPNHQTSAVYYNNLGRCYLELAKIQKEHRLSTKGAEFNEWAIKSFNDAIKQDCMQLSFYKNLVEAFELQGTLTKNLKKYQSQTRNPFNQIICALIYEKQGNKMTSRAMLENFISSHPDLLISTSLRDYLKK